MLALPRASVIDARVARRANARRKLSAARGGNAGPLSASRDARSTRARGDARASFSTASTPEAAMRGAMTRVRGDFVLARAESRGESMSAPPIPYALDTLRRRLKEGEQLLDEKRGSSSSPQEKADAHARAREKTWLVLARIFVF